MKITYLYLENFIQIKTGLGAYKLTLDLSETENKLCLLIGPNGIGKTSILSFLTPFATIGNLDTRNGNNLIIDGKNGYKEIHYKNGDDTYIIKHYYTPHDKKSHSVKSYIMKNDIELNENGNVGSFLEWVKIELGIELDFLKLIRIGSNVQSIIDMSTTERKNFMSKLLEDIGLFLMYYKKVNTDANQLKEMISHTVDKLNSIGFEDKESAKKIIHKLEKQLEELQNRYNKISGDISVYRHEIDQIPERETLKDRLSSSLKKLTKMERILDKKDSLESIDPNYYKERIDKLNQDIIHYQSELSTSNLLIQNHLNTMNQLEEQKRMLQIQYQKESESDKELQQMTKEYQNLIDGSDRIKRAIGDYKPEYTKKELEDFIVYLKNSQQILNKAYEFGKKSVEKVISLLRKNRNITTYIDNKIIDLGATETEESIFLHRLSQRFALNTDLSKTCPVDGGCEAMKLWIQVGNLIHTRDEERKDKEDIEFYKDLELVYANIKTVLSSIPEHKELILKFPEKVRDEFKLSTIYSRIENLKPFFDEPLFHDLLSIDTEYDNYITMLEQAKLLKKDIDRFTKMSNFGLIKDQLTIISNQFEETRTRIIDLKNRIATLKELVNDTNRDIERYQDLYETFTEYDELKSKSKELQDMYTQFVDNVNKIQACEVELHRIKDDIGRVNQDIQKKNSDLSMFLNLKKELKVFNLGYDEMLTVKESLSSKNGMSLYYIKNYLGNSEEIVNELLDIAYGGEKYIDKFKITATEFAIPWFNHGIRIDDVKYASQGEVSFISIALAFALAAQSLKKYNIMLLDELDGALDADNRPKFIPVIENQLERIHAEQSFAITHSDMFFTYPVDIIDLGFNHDMLAERYQMANFVDIRIA